MEVAFIFDDFLIRLKQGISLYRKLDKVGLLEFDDNDKDNTKVLNYKA